jgi:formylglycine-generating enzyme required for sulfatase activity
MASMKHAFDSFIATAAALLLASSSSGQTCAGDLNGDGRVDAADLATVLSNWGYCPPTVTSVSPSHGSTLGGTIITLTGTGLATTTAVSLGGAPCSSVTVLSPTQVRATTPAGIPGEVSVSVTTQSGTSLASTPFTYVVQSVSSIVPSSGPYAGGTAITITGQSLAGTTAVTVGGVPATNVVVVSPTTVTAVTPPGSVGAADVVLSGAKGNVSVPGGFRYDSLWYTVLEQSPNPAIVTDATLRNAILATGYPWRVRDNGTQIELVLIPPGTFEMGCSGSGQYSCAGGEYPVHTVSLTSAFYLGRYEVTQAQWSARMSSNPSYFQSASAHVSAAEVPSRPVEQLSWSSIEAFLVASDFRLPTEAEWEYAYRARTTTAFHSMPSSPNGTNDDGQVDVIAWFPLNSSAQTRPVGGKAGNGLGLHDMSGNVWEWCGDWYSPTYYASSPATNPTGPTTGTQRVIRGGSWFTGKDLPTYYVRSSTRGGGAPNEPTNNIGLRVARNPM